MWRRRTRREASAQKTPLLDGLGSTGKRWEAAWWMHLPGSRLASSPLTVEMGAFAEKRRHEAQLGRLGRWEARPIPWVERQQPTEGLDDLDE